MPAEPTQMAINENAPDLAPNVPTQPSQEGGEKLSLGEFENYQPTGQPPTAATPANKETPKTSAAKDTIDNKPELEKEKEDDAGEVSEEVEQEGETEGEVKEGTEKEGTEKDGEVAEEEEFPAHDDKDEKIHGNTKKDFTGLSKDEIAVCKRLDNARFNKIAPILRAKNEAIAKIPILVKELEDTKKLLKEGGIPQTWYEHPDAYQLSKEYQEIGAAYSIQDQAERHYEQQLLNVQQGRPWTSLALDQSGKLVVAQQHEASDQAAIWLQKQIVKATNQKGILEGKSQALQQGFAANYEKATGQVKGEVDDLVARMHPDLKPTEDDLKVGESVIPEVYRNHPLAYSQKVSFAVIKAQARMLQKLMTGQQQQARLKQDVAKAGPTKVAPKRPSAPVGNDKDKLRMSDFEK